MAVSPENIVSAPTRPVGVFAGIAPRLRGCVSLTWSRPTLLPDLAFAKGGMGGLPSIAVRWHVEAIAPIAYYVALSIIDKSRK